MILDSDAIRALVPHRGSMCLLDRVLFWDESQIECTTAQHRSTANPLLRDGRLSAVHAIEFAAQAMAVHGALLSPPHARATIGLLVSVRDCRFHCDRLDQVPGDLRVKSHRIAGNDRMLMYGFSVHDGARCLAEGRTSVLLADATTAAMDS